MLDELKDKCYICKRDIDDGEKCRGLLDGSLSVIHFHDGTEVVFCDDNDQDDAVLICKDCRPEHIRLMLHGRELLKALKASAEFIEDIAGERHPTSNLWIQVQLALTKIEGSNRETTDQKKG